MAEIRTTNVWIVEWLPAGERLTGQNLHDWMKEQRPGWSAYFPCGNKSEVIAAIARATKCAQGSEMIPVLHLESHGGDEGLEGPDGKGSKEFLTWDDLTEPLQQLNLATRCNLVVVVAACIGFAGVQAFRRGPRAPAVALVGPDAVVAPTNLEWGTKEFYRRWMDENPRLSDIAASASREAGTVSFEWEPFCILAYEALVESFIKSIRPAERLGRTERVRQRMLAETELTALEIESRLALLPPIGPWVECQLIWDQMFMIDLYPKNRERFGLDVKTIMERIARNIIP
jgi:hypothetical protein